MTKLFALIMLVIAVFFGGNILRIYFKDKLNAAYHKGYVDALNFVACAIKECDRGDEND